MNKEVLLSRLDTLQHLAEGSKWTRLKHQAWKYIFAMCFNHFVYPRTRKPVQKRATIITGDNMSVLLPASTDIYLTGGKTHNSEIRLARFLIKNLHAGDSFWDIGTHFGYFSLLAARLVGNTGTVLAVEAAPKSFQLLKENVHGFKQVKVFHNAIADGSKEITFYEFPILYSEYNSFDIEQYKTEPWFQKTKVNTLQIKTITLDELFQKSENKNTSPLIKIDVEGGELAAMQGGTYLLQEKQPCIIMEYLAPNRHNTVHQAAQKLLNELGYMEHIISKEGELQKTGNISEYLMQSGLESDNIVFKKP